MEQPTSPSFTFEPNSERFVRDPYPDFAWLRENAPIYYWGEYDNWLISGAEQVRKMLTDERLSASVKDWAHYNGSLFEQPRFAAWAKINAAGLFVLDSAAHARVRKLASVAFTPRAVSRLDDSIDAIVGASLDRVTAGGVEQINVRDYAEVIPLEVVCDLLGIPADDRAAFRRFGVVVVNSVMPSTDMAQLEASADAHTEGFALLERIIGERRAMSQRPDDLLTDLIEANEDGQRLTDIELISLTSGLIAAGSDTTVYGICYAIRSLLRHPEALRELQTDPSLLRGAIEESLRWDFFSKAGVMRYALADCEWEGVQLRKGQMLLGMINAAGRDPAVYEDPDRFDIHRDYRQNLSFGLGRHFCLGANLARSEIMRAVEALLIDRYPQATLVGEPVFNLNNVLMRETTELLVRLGPKAVPA